uniref:protein BIG GRAIN 1-like B n=1 Tax=Erigeron canadensis TaxID=72917 RepID=UPI001CB9C8A7|nr:protein BIG GRAIN 1-like B [Erigeron canadensis]
MYRPYRENPSFSSSLLDEIYRSIDQRDDQEQVTVFQKNPRNKHNSFSDNNSETALFEKWAEPITCKKNMTKKQSPPELKTGYNSSSSSSDSSGFSSSETESVYGFSSKPKPIRTNTDRHDKYSYNTRSEKDKQCNYKYNNNNNQKYQFDDFQAKPKHEGKFVNKTKSRAMKIYGDLKKVKQPISPGGRLATFLNSIFATNNNTKKIPQQSLESKSTTTTTCSSASSYSRSCLSKTPSSSSRGKLNTNTKRSVRFYLDTEKPCDIFIGLNQDDKTRQVEEAARNLLRNYQKKVECEFELSSNNVKSYNVMDMKYDEDDDDDVASHASSDLFELENLSAIGMGKYGDELPVYETTYLDMNLAIGNGFLM